MAEEAKKENDAGDNIRKCYNDVVFAKVKDKFNVLIQYDSNAEILSLSFSNTTTKDIFKQDFDKERICKITEEYKLETKLLCQMIMDILSSKEKIEQNMRIFILPNINQCTVKYNKIRTMKTVPDAMHIPTKFKPKCNDTNNKNNQLENYLLFVLHFSAPPYIYLNYCFMIKEEYVSDYDKLSMAFNDLQKENQSLQNQLNDAMNTSQIQQQQIDQLTQTTVALTQQMQILQAKSDTESKVEEIELDLQNNWAKWDDDWGTPKCIKIGNMIYVTGLIKSGTGNHIATLPQGWTPKNHKMFCQYSNNCCTRVDVYKNGQIHKISSWNTHLSLDGIIYPIQ